MKGSNTMALFREGDRVLGDHGRTGTVLSAQLTYTVTWDDSDNVDTGYTTRTLTAAPKQNFRTRPAGATGKINFAGQNGTQS